MKNQKPRYTLQIEVTDNVTGVNLVWVQGIDSYPIDAESFLRIMAGAWVAYIEREKMEVIAELETQFPWNLPTND